MPKTRLRIAGESSRGMPRKINFGSAALASVVCPLGRRDVHVYDARTPRLAYRVTDNGARAFYWIGKVRGRAQRVRLGGMEMTVEQARKRATSLNAQASEGGDPAAEKRALRADSTLQELWDRWWEEHATARLAARTRETDLSRFDTCFEDWKGRKLLSVTEENVRTLHAALGKKRGHVTANRAVQLLRKLYNFSRIGVNPAAKAVDLFRERSRDRFVQPDELPRFFEALDAPETNPLIRDFLYLCLWTGARRSNVAAMRDEEIALDAATWTVPAEKTKAHEPIIVPLTEPALAIIIRRMGHESGFIFHTHAEGGHLVDPKTTWKDVLKRAGLKDLRIHDLRRSLGSYQAALGSSLPIIGASLGHRNTAATQIYSRLHLEPVRASVTAAVAAMVAAGAVKQTNAAPTGSGDGDETPDSTPESGVVSPGAGEKDRI